MMDEVTSDDQAAAYMKLQLDVRQLIVDTIYKELMNYGSPLHTQIAVPLLTGYAFKENVKMVIQNQWNKQ